MTDWQQVARTLIARWPGQKWTADQAAEYVAEIQADGWCADQALAGLRLSTAAFVPSVGELRLLVRRARALSGAAVPPSLEARRLMALLERELREDGRRLPAGDPAMLGP